MGSPSSPAEVTTATPEFKTGPEKEPDLEAETSTTDDAARQTTGLRWAIVCTALYVSCFMYGLDTTIAADIQSAVIETFPSAVPQLPWIGAGFPLGLVAVILPYVSLFGLFNMKWLYLGGILLFQAGSALCGAAPSRNALVVGRVLAGASETGIYLGGLNSFSALTRTRERPLYLTGIACVWSMGCILGPVVGGSFSVSAATWRWSFYMNLVMAPSPRPSTCCTCPTSTPRPGLTRRAATWVTFSLAFVSAGGTWAWSDGRTIATLVVFGVLLLVYICQQGFCLLTTPATRSFPCHLLRSRTQVLLALGTGCSTAAMYVTTYYCRCTSSSCSV